MIPLNKPKVYHHFFNGSLKSTEDILKSLFDAKYIEMIFSARQGLDLIYKEIFNKKGSCKVAVSPLTCFEALYPIIHNKHSIVFVDINSQTFNMDENLIPKDIDVIQPIHFGGNPQDMDTIVKKAQDSLAIVVEDCAQAFGSSYKDIPLGNFGDFSSFSLGKNLFSLAGGFILSNDKIKIPSYQKALYRYSLYKYLKRYLEVKNSFNANLYEDLLLKLLNMKPESTSFVFSKYTINKSMQKSIRNQLNHHEQLINKRKEIACKLVNKIKNKKLVKQKNVRNGMPSYTRLLYKLENGDTRAFINELRQKNIWANHLSQNTLSNYQENVFKIKEFKGYAKKYDLTNYLEIHDRIISFPISPALTEKEIDYIVYHINML